jgi:hypothetical protein
MTITQGWEMMNQTQTKRIKCSVCGSLIQVMYSANIKIEKCPFKCFPTERKWKHTGERIETKDWLVEKGLVKVYD